MFDDLRKDTNDDQSSFFQDDLADICVNMAAVLGF